MTKTLNYEQSTFIFFGTRIFQVCYEPQTTEPRCGVDMAMISNRQGLDPRTSHTLITFTPNKYHHFGGSHTTFLGNCLAFLRTLHHSERPEFKIQLVTFTSSHCPTLNVGCPQLNRYISPMKSTHESVPF